MVAFFIISCEKLPIDIKLNASTSQFAGAWVALLLGLVGVLKVLASGFIETLALPFIELVTKISFWKFLYKFLYIPINLVFMAVMLNRLSALYGM